MEIGFGNAQFLLELARSRPDVNVVGVEISQPSLRKAARKSRRQGLDNVLVLQGEAQGVVWALCPPQSLAQVYINFPDPWPKAAHHHRRLIDDAFLDLLATRMPAGAPLEIATDHDDYAAWIEEALTRSPYFHSRLPRPFLTQPGERLRTKYEQLALEQGRTCRYFRWARNERPPARAFAIPQELPMPHVVIRSAQSPAQIGVRFESFSQTGPEGAVRFIALYESTGQETLLVDTHVEEEPFAQRVGLTVRRRPAEAGAAAEWVLGLHELGFPRPTAGVHQAIHFLARWFMEGDEDAAIVNSNLQVDQPSTS